MKNLLLLAARVKDSSFVEPLFRRVSESKYQFVYRPAEEALLAYGSRIIEKRLADIRKKKLR